MFTQLLRILTPELIIQAVKDNPKVILETLHKFDTFKLIGSSLNTDQQIALSNNTALVNNFLASESSKAAISTWADEFTIFIQGLQTEATAKIEAEASALALANKAATEVAAKQELRSQMEAEIREEIRLEQLTKPKVDIVAQIKAELEANARAGAAFQSKGIEDLEIKTKALLASRQ